MKRAIEYGFTDLTTPIASYDPAKICLGTLMRKNTGVLATDKWVGPMATAIARIQDAQAGLAASFPSVVSRSTDVDEIYLVEMTSATTSRRIMLWTFTKSTGVFAYVGYVTLATFCATAATVRGFKVTRHLYTTGTVAVNGTAVTGSGTAWVTARFAPGRIGFGSTDPQAISTWYDIASIGGEGTITLTLGAGVISAGASYVIEEYRALVAVTAATTITNGGLFVAKGLHPGLFSSATSIALASATDNLRNVYWLADAASVTNTIAAGLDVDTSTLSNTNQDVYVLNATSSTSATMYKYNARAALGSLASGKSVSAFVLKTGAAATTATMAQTQSMNLATASHGPGSGVACLYFVSTTRIYRAPLTGIVDTSTTWIADTMQEVPPGGTNTFAASAVMASVTYDSYMDMFYVHTSGSAGARSYLTQYNAVGTAMNYIFTAETKQQDQASASADTVPHLSVNALPFVSTMSSGTVYLCRTSTATATNQMYASPLGAHWTGAATRNQRVLTPAIATTDAVKLYGVSFNSIRYLGGADLGIPAEPFRTYYRTSGISDNTGSWTSIGLDGDLSGAAPGAAIQFAIEYKLLGHTGIHARLLKLAVIYEDSSTLSNYEPSISKSDKTANRIAWRQKTAFSGTIPALSIKVNKVSDGSLVLSDTTTAHGFGTWEYSTDGLSWLAWSASADAVGNYIRYTASSLPDSVVVRAILNLA